MPKAEVGDIVRVKRGTFKMSAKVIGVADKGVYIRTPKKHLLFFEHEEYHVVQ